MSTANRLLEQAVSIWTLGPLRSKYQLTRFEISDDAAPVAAVRSTFSGSCESILDQSSVKDAENTAVLEPLSFSAGIPARNSSVSKSIALSGLESSPSHHFRKHGMMSPASIVAWDRGLHDRPCQPVVPPI